VDHAAHDTTFTALEIGRFKETKLGVWGEAVMFARCLNRSLPPMRFRAPVARAYESATLLISLVGPLLSALTTGTLR
jgi:hypothetical protein